MPTEKEVYARAEKRLAIIKAGSSLRPKKHSPAGKAHLVGHSLGVAGQALKKAKQIHKKATALDEATRHDKGSIIKVPKKKTKKVHYRAYGWKEV